MAAKKLTALAVAVSLAHKALAQSDMQYTVWSSVLFQTSGERTPEVIVNLPTTLTSVGANQAYTTGAFFRHRYIEAAQNASINGDGNGAGDLGAPLFGLNENVYDVMQTYVMAVDQPWTVATAQAFLQGFYPPFTDSSNSPLLATSSILANGSYVDSPLGGYQYPWVQTAGAFDPNFIFLSGNLNCPAFADAAHAYTTSNQFKALQQQYKDIYNTVGEAVLQGIIPSDEWDYTNAYAIYDYLRYQYAHNGTVQHVLDGFTDTATNRSYLTILKDLADEQQWAQQGNLSAINPDTGTSGLPDATVGSISTIGGNLLAAQILDLLSEAVSVHGRQNKLNLLFSDFQPLTSFFSLVGLPSLNAHFYGMPNFGSVAGFELFSYTNMSINSTNSDIHFPRTEDLWVRFFFMNGTSGDEPYQAYPIFNRGPSQTDMLWSDFRYSMQDMLMSDNVQDWCTQCHAVSSFCQVYNRSASSSSSNTNGLLGGSGPVPPVAAGLIGAFVALGVAALTLAAAMLFAGVRFHRKPRRAGGELAAATGGFKGGLKLRSDQDLTIPKGGAVAVTDVPIPAAAGGHERVGSWELKNTDTVLRAQPEMDYSARPSMEQNPAHENIFGLNVVQPEERV